MTYKAARSTTTHALGLAAVRGHLCGPCNLRMTAVDAGVTPVALDSRYLEQAWHLTRGVPFVYDNRAAGRNLRVDEKLWAEAKRIADERRETLSAVMKRALVEYVEKHGGSVER